MAGGFKSGNCDTKPTKTKSNKDGKGLTAAPYPKGKK